MVHLWKKKTVFFFKKKMYQYLTTNVREKCEGGSVERLKFQFEINQTSKIVSQMRICIDDCVVSQMRIYIDDCVVQFSVIIKELSSDSISLKDLLIGFVVM